MPVRRLKDNPSFVEDDSSGHLIIKPASMVGSSVTPYQHPFSGHPFRASYHKAHSSVRHVPGLGTSIAEDDNGIVIWPAYASGWDDLLSRALAGGHLIDVNVTGVADPYLSTVVAKIQSMVRTWVNRVRGRRSPVKRMLDIMARADDSQFGAADFVGNFMGALAVDNRGALGAQVPFATIAFDKWGEFGMEAEEIPGEGKGRDKPGKEAYFVLRMTTEAFRENRGLWTVDGLHCYPTGISEYPYWYRTYSRELKKACWVLIHRDFGWQIIAQNGPRSSSYPGFGQSGAWRYSPYVAKGIAVDTMDWEHLIAQPMRGIVWVSGLDTPTQFRDQLQAFQQDQERTEMRFYPGVFFGGSRNDKASITMLPWSEPPAGWTPESWQREKVDALAAAFHMSSTQLQVRLGEGALTQSDVAAAMEAETAIAYWRHAVEQIFNFIAPPRVTVTTIWPSDRNKRLMVETARELSLAIQRVNQPGLMNEAELVFDREDIRNLFKEFVGIPLPDDLEGQVSADDRHSGEDIPQSVSLPSHTTHHPPFMASPDELLYLVSQFPQLAEGHTWDVGQTALIRDTGDVVQTTSWDSRGAWVWVRKQNGRELLLSKERLVPLETVQQRLRQVKSAAAAQVTDGCGCGCGHNHDGGSGGGRLSGPFDAIPHTWRRGEKATFFYDRMPVHISHVDEDGTPHGVFVEDGSGTINRFRPGDLLPLAFQPEGDPLPYPEEVDIDWEEAQIAAENLLGKVVPEFLEGNWVWDEDERVWVNEDNGEAMTPAEMVQVRDAIADGAEELHTTWPPPEDEEEPTEDDGRDNFLWLLFLGLITLTVWEERMRTAVRDAVIAQWLVGRGGVDQLTDEDRARLEALILLQWQFLNEFAQAIATGTLSEAQIAWQAGLYYSDTVRSFEQGHEAAWDYALQLPAYPGDCSSECCARDRCWVSYVDTGETIEIEWNRTVTESCPTCVARARCPALVFYPATGELVGGECW